jgi:hypothetical protein
MPEPFRTKSRLTSFLYELMRDHVTPGVIEKIVSTDEEVSEDDEDFDFLLSTYHLAAYADELAERLTSR